MASLGSLLLTINAILFTYVSTGWIAYYKYLLADFAICQREKPDVIVWVQGRATSLRHRSMIREYMANKKMWPYDVHAVLLFFVGISSSPETQKLLEYEYEIYGDIVQNNYTEHYKNQTAKMMSAINFISSFCNDTKISIRMDDDVIFNPMNLISAIINMINQKNSNTYNMLENYHGNLKDQINQENLEELTEGVPLRFSIDSEHNRIRKLYESFHYNRDRVCSPSSLRDIIALYIPGNTDHGRKCANRRQLDNLLKNTVVCHVLRNRPVYRKSDLYYNLDHQYLPNENMLPEFCAGFFFAFTSDLIPKFKHLFKSEPPFWIDDSYLGILQKRLKTVNVEANKYLSFSFDSKANFSSENKSLVIHLEQGSFFKTFFEARAILDEQFLIADDVN